MDRTVAARCLVFLERAIFQANICVFKKFTTVITEFAPGMVMVPAVDNDHLLNCLALPLHTGMQA
jgi:hypothetical protein